MTSDLMPADQSGRLFVVTGANAGLGFETTLALTRLGARVVMACRNQERAMNAADRIRRSVPGAELEVMHLDLGDLASVRRFAGELRDRHERLDVLVNNAGLILVRQSRTTDGFESQFGTNVLGHFLLTSLLLDAMPDDPRSRVVHLTSNTHKWYRLDFEDLQSLGDYSRGRAYGRSKLANLVVAVELQRRLEAAGSRVLSVSAHPGMAVGTSTRNATLRRVIQCVSSPLNNPVDQAARPTVLAATAPGIRGGDYIGPQGPFSFRGEPGRSHPAPQALEVDDARRLWRVACSLTGAAWPFDSGSQAATTAAEAT